MLGVWKEMLFYMGLDLFSFLGFLLIGDSNVLFFIGFL